MLKLRERPQLGINLTLCCLKIYEVRAQQRPLGEGTLFLSLSLSPIHLSCSHSLTRLASAACGMHYFLFLLALNDVYHKECCEGKWGATTLVSHVGVSTLSPWPLPLIHPYLDQTQHNKWQLSLVSCLRSKATLSQLPKRSCFMTFSSPFLASPLSSMPCSLFFFCLHLLLLMHLFVCCIRRHPQSKSFVKVDKVGRGKYRRQRLKLSKMPI